ncbi:DUF4276 family protein [Pseudomonas oryzihabitans]|uniref:DUF4276 family protein n=1 Tax=Pseudomonas oryzihabitans TaxID=47885 RepID=UPI001F109E82|nr:DUF4276 family protein [Pseudomonas psychrotolerans]
MEGPTEERLIKAVLVPYMQERGKFLCPISIGGNVSVDKVAGELKKLANSFDYVSTFYDFYGFKRRQPGETKATLENRLLQAAAPNIQQRFLPYVQMYELEGILFSSPTAIAQTLQSPALESWATQIVTRFGGDPERINDSPQTAPSKRLEQHSDYRKTTHGPDIAKLIGVERLREACRGFDAWLIALEAFR